MASSNRSARHRAKLKAKLNRRKLRRHGLMKKKKAGGRMKVLGASKRASGLR
ncbi:MAG: hypothetical protein H6739_41240 [Alphaproteobacteria bacterium]|nr:hypothetical protein [Alphaproteobacteria bacterium]